MQRRIQPQYETFAGALAALENGAARPFEGLGLSPESMKFIHSIMHRYSSELPDTVRDLIFSSLSASSPEHALIRCDRVIGALGDDPRFLRADKNTVRLIAMTVSWSSALAGRLAGDPSILTVLSALDDPFSPRREPDYYLGRFSAAAAGANDPPARVREIHREHTAQLIRILARNSDPVEDIEVVNEELSALADAAVEICLRIVSEETGSDAALSPPHGLAVIGLGKLGGSELNVSSDIDLLYLYDDRGGDSDTLISHLTRIAERLTRLLSEPTEHGALYRVDTRLRADGASGPLVRSMRDYYRYLEMRGEAWERQMLLKARPVAGDRRAAERFLTSLEHFVFPSALSRSPNREIATIKSRIESRLTADGTMQSHLKLAPGGIRDIEFIVQCLQLLAGGSHPEARRAGTIPALDALRDIGSISMSEHRTLGEAYRFFRRIENALQWRELIPAIALPENFEDRKALALFLGTGLDSDDPGEVLRGEMERMFREVREIYDDVFASGKSSAEGKTMSAMALGSEDTEATKRYLENLGFPDPETSARTLARLLTGGVQGSGQWMEETIERFAHALFRNLSGLPDPGGALERLEQIVHAYNSRVSLFDMLTGKPKLLELLVSIAHSSVFLTGILTRDPSLLDWLAGEGALLSPPVSGEITSEIEEIDRVSSAHPAFTRSCRPLKNREELRIGARCVSGLSDTPATFGELTTVAECFVRAAADRARRSEGDRGRAFDFAVIGAGRLGAGMMDFGSDLDLIFVYRGAGDPQIAERAVRRAQLILTLLTGGGGPDKLYDIDARLRPEGGNSVLAISLEEYCRYLDTRASEWERLAMIRARPVAGSGRLGGEIAECLQRFVYRGAYTEEEIRRIMFIRAKAVEHSRRRHGCLINVKSGPGGLADIDFIAHTLASHYGADHPALRRRATEDILSALAEERLLDRGESSSIGEGYRFLRDVEKAIRIGSGRSVNTLDSSGTDTARAARLLGYRNLRKFLKKVEDVTTLSRERYERTMGDLLDSAADPRMLK
jgi:[glutamine synthetase] adenylyltransferase / [glutamine synthetase]-adenylyl-L-tyrosine phosphorylase